MPPRPIDSRRLLLATLLAIIALVPSTGVVFGSRHPAPARQPTPQPTSIRTQTFSKYGLTFTYPMEWTLYQYEVIGSFTTLIAYLSNVPLHDPCTRTASDVSCDPILDDLPRGGVLVAWTTNGFAGWTLKSQRGKRVLLGGHLAKLDIQRHTNEGCPSGSQETMTAAIARRARYNWYGFRACMRGPHLKVTESRVLALLHSIRIDEGTM